MPALDSELRERLHRYVVGEIDLHSFREWFVAQAWNIDKRVDESTAALVHEVDLVLAEFDHGDWTEEEVKHHFNSLIEETTTVQFSEIPPWIQSSSTSSAVWPELRHTIVLRSSYPAPAGARIQGNLVETG